MPDVAPDADAFLGDHLWGVLTTIRASGGPQVSMVAYDWDGTDLVISCRSSAAKFVNASQRPDVALSVSDEADCATVVGRAVVHRTGPERDARTDRVGARLRLDAPWAAEILDQQIAAGLDEVGRVTITVVPDDVRLVRPLG
ncbi:MAG: pyridoxamine 5'-phosphate oxidase family protein [Actinomycetota bacterium]